MEKNFLLLAILIAAFALTVLVHAQDQSGFISIDCGIPDGSSYKDGTTGINYTSDSDFIDTGININISTEFKNKTGVQQQLWNVRSFPEGTKNCYTLRPSQGKDNNYLIRASFLYGDYDGNKTGRFPEFDLYLGVNRWDSIIVDDSISTITKEIIHVPSSDYIYVCLVNTGNGTPFISVLELRLLNNNSYIPETGSLELFARLDCGSKAHSIVRFKEDVYDRIWSPFNSIEWEINSTSQTVDSQSHNDYQIPSVVMSTAVTPKNRSDSLGFYWEPTDNATSQFYLYLHFAEIENLRANQSREFNIFLNGNLWYGNFTPTYLSTTTIFSAAALIGTNFEVRLTKTNNSTLPPLLNAFEIYSVKQLFQSQTDQKDVDAINNIKSFYGIKRNWQGDPCAPKDYIWNGLNCSYNGYDPPRIISLNLSSSGLTGEIASYISNLSMIQYLDLSNNSLNGTVPNFLSQLQFLQVLFLEGNKLSGPVPAGLIERQKNGSLTLRVDETPNLCPPDCNKKKNNNIVVPIVAAVAGFVILLLSGVALLWFLKRRKQAAAVGNYTNAESNKVSASKKQNFTYSEILSITNNFERVVGKGGFGTVYHGYLDGTQVSVKMFSSSSVQGYKEFQAEATFLRRVHHRNLTSLVGYCDEGNDMGLIYEYMVNENLAWHLSDTNANLLSWENRLKIALDAAKGLEYLHNGCKPPIIHRDLKSTNILLNENLEAKLADFGLSRIFPVEGGSNASTVVVGTPGYLDPEYTVSNRLNEKSDVYSFGIVLLEIITGRPAITKDHEKIHLVQWVNSMLEKEDIKTIVDPRLQRDFDINSAWKAVEVALVCAYPTFSQRPTMTYVVTELNECLAMEMAWRNEGHDAESNEYIDMTPQAR